MATDIAETPRGERHGFSVIAIEAWLLSLSRLVSMPARMTADFLADKVSTYAPMLADLPQSAFDGDALRAAGLRFRTFPSLAEISDFLRDRVANSSAPTTDAKTDEALCVTNVAATAAAEWRERNWSKYWSPAIADGYASELDKWARSAFASMHRSGGIADPMVLTVEQWRIDAWKAAAAERRACHEGLGSRKVGGFRRLGGGDFGLADGA